MILDNDSFDDLQCLEAVFVRVACGLKYSGSLHDFHRQSVPLM